MNWIQTYTGQVFYPLDPDPAAINILDIAHALALTNRFGGHSRVPYSVAHHSVLVSRHVPASLALYGLLHDAAEAYLCDMPRPVKRCLTGYSEAEGRLQRAILERFGLEPEMPEEVKDIDQRILCDEAAQVMGPHPKQWEQQAEPLGIRIWPVGWRQAETSFLERWRRLCDGRKSAVLLAGAFR